MTARPPRTNKQVAKDSLADVPEVKMEAFVMPDFTIKELISVIPPHCYERSTLKSASYVARAYLSWFVLGYAAKTYIPLINPDNFEFPDARLYTAARFVAWMTYGFIQGVISTSLFVAGHECGHGAFSASKFACNFFGHVCHTPLLLPFFSWQATHAVHHQQTNNTQKDSYFLARSRSDWKNLPKFDPEQENMEGTKVTKARRSELMEILHESFIVTSLSMMVVSFFVYQVYMVEDIINPYKEKKIRSHYKPWSDNFPPPVRKWIALSDATLLAFIYVLYKWAQQTSYAEVGLVWGLPYLWANHWWMMMAYLQHTDPEIPRYSPEAHTFTKSLFLVKDRDMMGGGSGIIGKIVHEFFRTFTLSINETHFLHHLQMKIPHYNAAEASRAVEEKILKPNGINIKGRPATWLELMRVYHMCKFIEDEGDVRFLKNEEGQAYRVMGQFERATTTKDLDSASDSAVEM